MKLAAHRTRPRSAIGALLGLASLIAFTSCGGSGDDSDSRDGKTKITLSMQQADVENADPATWSIVQAFMKENPDVEVAVEGQPVDQHTQNMIIAAQSGTLPEVFWIPDATARELAAGNALLDLSPILDDGLGDTFAPNFISAYNNGDIQYGVPYEALITGFFYNSAILEELGLQLPTTIDDLLGFCTAASEAGVVPISKGANQSAFSVWAFLGMLERFGYDDRYQQILDGSDSFDNPDFLNYYGHIADMRDAECFPENVATQNYQQALDAFAAGDAAMFDSGVFASAQIDGSPAAQDVGFWAGPTFPDGVGEQAILMNVPSVPLAVSGKVADDAAKLDAVTRFLNFYYSQAGQELYVENGKPPLTDIDVAVDEATQPAFAAVLEAAADPAYTSPPGQPDLVVPTAVGSAMYDSIYGVIQGVLTPEQAVDTVQAAIDEQQ